MPSECWLELLYRMVFVLHRAGHAPIPSKSAPLRTLLTALLSLPQSIDHVHLNFQRIPDFQHPASCRNSDVEVGAAKPFCASRVVGPLSAATWFAWVCPAKIAALGAWQENVSYGTDPVLLLCCKFCSIFQLCLSFPGSVMKRRWAQSILVSHLV